MNERGKVYCEACAAWIPVGGTDEWVECDCGSRFVVTITEMPSASH